jgi:hypothetical protein
LTPINAIGEDPFADTGMVVWESSAADVSQIKFPIDLVQIANREVVAGLTNAQRRYLSQNGFIVVQGQERDFSTIRHKVSTQYGQPYFMSTDVAAYALKSTADALLIALEREELSRRLALIVKSTLDEVQSYLPGLRGSALEKDAKLALVYLSVGLQLLDPEAQIELEPDLQALQRAQVEQVLHAAGVEGLTMLPGVLLDFRMFSAPEIYQGDAFLEAYFRGRTWFEQASFPLEDKPGLQASRAPLIINLALQRARIEGHPSAQLWAELDETMAFFYGRSQDDDPRRYAALIDRVYGNKISVLALADDDAWQVFRILAQTLPATKAYSSLSSVSSDQRGNRDWRFWGRRLLPDAIVFSVLPARREQTPDLPQETASGLDWMATSGWRRAEEILAGYQDVQPEAYLHLKAAVQSQDDNQWTSTFWGAWNFSFLPSRESSVDVFPMFVQQQGWAQKELVSALGSWALSHQRAGEISFHVNSSDQFGQPISNPAPAYVEPAPEVFYRLSYLAHVIVDGLSQRQMTGLLLTEEQDSKKLADLLQSMRDLGDRLSRLGDLAAKEIQGIPLDLADFALIQSPLGLVDVTNTNRIVQGVKAPGETVPVMEIGVADRNGDQVLQVGTGFLDWLYVIVPLHGELQIAQGGIFSYNEFNLPDADQLSAVRWQWIVKHAQPERPVWSITHLLPDGAPYFVLAFRVGDTYRITPAGANLSLRSEPSRRASTLQRLKVGETVQILAGPVEAEGSTWWKISALKQGDNLSIDGWVIESQDWFERVWESPQ